jgi:hypothetical protein
MNTDRLKAGVAQARAASTLFQVPTMDIGAFQEGLTKAEEAINALKAASGMVTNYPINQQPPYTIKQMDPDALAAAMMSDGITPGEGEEEEEEETPSVPAPKAPLASVLGPGEGKPLPLNAGRSMASVLAKSRQRGGQQRRSRRNQKRAVKHRASTHKRHRASSIQLRLD